MYTDTENFEIKNLESEIKQTEGRIFDIKKDLTAELRGLNKLRSELTELLETEKS